MGHFTYGINEFLCIRYLLDPLTDSGEV